MNLNSLQYLLRNRTQNHTWTTRHSRLVGTNHCFENTFVVILLLKSVHTEIIFLTSISLLIYNSKSKQLISHYYLYYITIKKKIHIVLESWSHEITEILLLGLLGSDLIQCAVKPVNTNHSNNCRIYSNLKLSFPFTICAIQYNSHRTRRITMLGKDLQVHHAQPTIKMRFP